MLYSTENTKIPNEPSLENQRHTIGRRNIAFWLYYAYTIIEVYFSSLEETFHYLKMCTGGDRKVFVLSYLLVHSKLNFLSIVRLLFVYCSSIVLILFVYCSSIVLLLFVYCSSIARLLSSIVRREL